MGWLTGNLTTPPTGYICRRLLIPDDPDLVAATNGALLALTRAWNWEKFGAMTPDDAAAIMAIMWDEYKESDACMIGTVTAYATVNPPGGVLACDGATYARADYPRLYDALDPVYHVSPTAFRVPDLRGRAVIGVGLGSGLTDRAIDDIGGAETHALIVDEMPEHTHSSDPHTHDLYAVAAFNVVNTGDPSTPLLQSPLTEIVTAPATVTIANTGGDEPHENMPPFLALRYGIVAR